MGLSKSSHSPSEATCATIIFTPISSARFNSKGFPKLLSRNPTSTVCSYPFYLFIYFF